MDMQSQVTRSYGHAQAEDPIRVHHPEEEEHQEKGATKVLKKVKAKAKKIKNNLTKHGHGHEHDHDVEIEDDEYDEKDGQLHAAPVYAHGGVTGHPESLSHPGGEANIPAPGEIVPPGTKVFPVVSSDYTKPVEPEPLRDNLYGHEAASHLREISERDERIDSPSHPLGAFDVSEREESREAHRTPRNTPASLLSETEDVTRTFTPGEDEYIGGQRKVNVERSKGLEEDSASLGGGSNYLSGVSNYQTKVTDSTHEGGGQAGVPGIVESLGRMKVIDDESPDQKPGRGFESDFPTRSHEFGPVRSDDEKFETELGRGLPAGTHHQFSSELSRPKERVDVDSKAEETHESKPSTYTEKIGSATSFVTCKATAAKNAVASKLGYSGESGGGGGQHQSSVEDETTPKSTTGYGQKVVRTLPQKMTPVYEKVKETGSTVMKKLPLSGGGSVGVAEENKQVEDKGVSTIDYLAEKLRPGEEDKALAEVIAEKLHLGGTKTTTTKEVEVTVEKIPTDHMLDEKEHGEAVVAEEGQVGGGMVGKLKAAVSSWLGGTTEEVKKPKSSDSLDQSSQSLGTTVGTMGFSDSGGALSGHRELQDSRN